jgi:hypothetical protein
MWLRAPADAVFVLRKADKTTRPSGVDLRADTLGSNEDGRGSPKTAIAQSVAPGGGLGWAVVQASRRSIDCARRLPIQRSRRDHGNAVHLVLKMRRSGTAASQAGQWPYQRALGRADRGDGLRIRMRTRPAAVQEQIYGAFYPRRAFGRCHRRSHQGAALRQRDDHE